jgi:hypothetical protein
MRKESAVTYFKILSKQLLAETEKNTKIAVGIVYLKF